MVRESVERHTGARYQLELQRGALLKLAVGVPAGNPIKSISSERVPRDMRDHI